MGAISPRKWTFKLDATHKGSYKGCINKLPSGKRAEILGMMVEGMSLRAIARLTGASKNTIVKLLEDAGEAFSDYQDRTLRNLTCKRIRPPGDEAPPRRVVVTNSANPHMLDPCLPRVHAGVQKSLEMMGMRVWQEACRRAEQLRNEPKISPDPVVVKAP